MVTYITRFFLTKLDSF